MEHPDCRRHSARGRLRSARAQPGRIVEGFQQSLGRLVLAAEREPCRRRKQSLEILVVDDSLTTRTLEKSVLEAHGYQVAIAVDGIDALNYLRAEPAALVISDCRCRGWTALGCSKR